MSLPHMDVPRPPVPTSAIRSFLPVGAEIPVVFAFISDKGLSKAVPAIAPVVARKCLLDIWFVVLCMVMMFCMFLWSVFRFSMISYSAILEFFSNSSSEHCKYMQFWGIGKDRMNIFGEAINAFYRDYSVIRRDLVVTDRFLLCKRLCGGSFATN